ncbi:MAG TPA: hypothetical protein VFB80_01145 [Pirellulaceae bacterium]|nr:hypothetical protein [Pirellulaceae bacterium]
MAHRWHYLPIGLVISGVLAVCAAAAANHAALGWWQALIYAGCAAAAGATLLFRRKLGLVEVELDQFRRRLAAEEDRLNEQRSQLEVLRRTVEDELQSQASRLDKREQALADRLVTYHEWMEFPQPTELSQPAAASDAELAALARKDRELQELLKAETKSLYDRILQNKYAPQGQVLLPVIRDDVLALVLRVARIYQPTIEQPLLEASLPRVLRGISRASLQLLVVLDELPVNIQGASLNTLYGYVRNAVSAWRMYKSAEPYWPYVNTAYYLGRFALGANPITLGAWWFVSSLGTRGAQAIAQHVINRQALELLSSLVRVIGYEVAGIYGGDIRHRDANWIYAAELTELVSQFPLSRDSLAHALREVGTLQLRSEYDRAFLYRCLAGRKSAHPEQYSPAKVLSMEERRAAATRLERFLEAFIHGKSADRVAQWKSAAEERLGVKLSVSLKVSPATVRDQIVDAVRSLASFLVSIKQLEPPEAVKLLAESTVLAQLPAEERPKLLEELAAGASYFFEHADLDPDGDLVEKYLDDLAALHAAVPPRGAGIEETLADVAAYLRRPPKKMHALAEKHYAARLAQRMIGDPARKIPPQVARAALDLLVDPAEPARLLLGPATLEWPDGGRPETVAGGELWLLGVDQRLILFAAAEQPQVIWRGTPRDVHAEQARQLLGSSCRLTGGQWQTNGRSQPLAIRLPAALMSSYAGQFRPLLEMLGNSPKH